MLVIGAQVNCWITQVVILSTDCVDRYILPTFTYEAWYLTHLATLYRDADSKSTRSVYFLMLPWFLTVKYLIAWVLSMWEFILHTWVIWKYGFTYMGYLKIWFYVHELSENIVRITHPYSIAMARFRQTIIESRVAIENYFPHFCVDLIAYPCPEPNDGSSHSLTSSAILKQLFHWRILLMDIPVCYNMYKLRI